MDNIGSIMAEEEKSPEAQLREGAKKAAEKWASQGDPEAVRTLAELAGLDERERLTLLKRAHDAAANRNHQFWRAYNDARIGTGAGRDAMGRARSGQLNTSEVGALGEALYRQEKAFEAIKRDTELRINAHEEVSSFIDKTLKQKNTSDQT